MYSLHKLCNHTDLLLILDRPPIPDDILIMGWWSANPQTEDKEKLDSVPIDLNFYSRPVEVTTLLAPTRPNPPPPCCPPVTSPLFFTELPPAEPPPCARYYALELSPSLADPQAPLGAGGAHPVGGSEPSLTARI